MRSVFAVAGLLVAGLVLPALHVVPILLGDVAGTWIGPQGNALVLCGRGAIGLAVAVLAALPSRGRFPWQLPAAWAAAIGAAAPLVLLGFRLWRRRPLHPYFHKHANPVLSWYEEPAHVAILLAVALGAAGVGAAGIVLAPGGPSRRRAAAAEGLVVLSVWLLLFQHGLFST